jgi:hypothetical protein
MYKVCAWCHKDLGTLPPLQDERTTHGMCNDCAKQQEDELQWKKDVERLKKECRF